MIEVWITQVGFCYYVSPEGKSNSVVKSELKRGIFKHPEIEIHSDDAAIDIIRSEVKERTKQLDFFLFLK